MGFQHEADTPVRYRLRWNNMTNDNHDDLALSDAAVPATVKDDLLITCEARLSVFNSAIDRTGGEDSCWPWKRALNKDGYGRFKMEGHYPMAHRVAYRQSCGPIPVDFKVCHSCDNPPCCNPRHFFLGTDVDNVADRHAKGRDARGDNHGLRKHPERVARGVRQGAYTCPEKIRKGACHGNSKLTDEKVLFIRTSPMSNAELASFLNMNKSHIWKVRTRRAWAHIP